MIKDEGDDVLDKLKMNLPFIFLLSISFQDVFSFIKDLKGKLTEAGLFLQVS